MKKKEVGMEKDKNTKNQSELVTKETVCAVFALFSALAFLVLCTGDLVFGTIGFSICSFLTGVFGYAAYPVCLGTLYLCLTSLIGKRFVKNRKAFTFGLLSVSSLALLIHAITTASWDLSTYALQCFNAGNQFPSVTVCGWLGGVLVLALASSLTKTGAIIIFSALILFFGYLAYFYARRTAKKVEGVQAETSRSVTPVEIPLTTSNEKETIKEEAAFVQAENNVNKTYEEMINQRPQFSLDNENQAESTAFSPFATPNYHNGRTAISKEDSRKFLFGKTPAENYKDNLIFDPKARVNQRPSVDPNESPTVNGEYTPSYLGAYQSSINIETSVRPQKILTDNTIQSTEPVTVIEPIEPIKETTVAFVDVDAERETERNDDTFVEPTQPERYTDSFEESTKRETNDYSRHEYMDLFSSSNPNVFGDSEEDRAFADETFNRTPSLETIEEELRFEREELSLREDENENSIESTREEAVIPTRDGLHIFDEEENAFANDALEERGGDAFGSRERDFTSAFREETPVVDSSREFSIETDRKINVELPKKEEEKAAIPKPRVIRPYVRVPLDDFDCRDIEPQQNPEEVEETKATILATLEDYKISGASIASVTFGPTVTRYNVTIPRNIPPKKVVALDQPIAISLFSSGVNIYPNYEDGVVSIEVPNKQRQFVQLGCMLTGDTFVNAKSSSIMFTMGKDAGNRKVYGDISKMIHMLVAGSSGSGKSVFLGSLITSLIYKYSPEELRLILIDPKKTEFVLYNNLPHLMINEIITDANKAIQSLNWAIGEMNRRYGLFEQMSRSGTYVVNLDQYNSHLDKAERLPKIVIIIDELADLMLAAKKDIEDRIQNLTQKARAAGIHLVVATQRPSTDVITGVIKSNLPTRIAFAVATDVDSRVILDQTGAQKLLGKGDFLYTMQGINTPVRVQSAFISPEDSQRIINFIKANNEAYYDENATAFINNTRTGNDNGSFGSSDEIEPVYIDALRYVILSNSASISLIQRKCSIGYNKAGKIVEWMEDMGYISSFEGAKARKVLITKEEFESKYGSL